MPEVFRLPYAQSHKYLDNIVKCFDEQIKNETFQNDASAYRDIILGLFPIEDFYLSEPEILKVKESVISYTPQILRTIDISTISGFPSYNHLQQYEVFTEQMQHPNSQYHQLLKLSEIKAASVHLNEDGTWESDDNEINKIIDKAKFAICLNNESSKNYCAALSWSYLMSKYPSTIRRIKSLRVKIDGHKTQHGNIAITMHGANYLRGHMLVTTRAVVKTNHEKKIFYKYPPITVNSDNKIGFNVDFALLLDKIFGVDAKTIFSTLGRLEAHVKNGRLVTPISVTETNIGPFLFSGNAPSHSYDYYCRLLDVTRQVLKEKYPRIFLRASLASQIEQNPEEYALICSYTKSTSSDSQSETDCISISRNLNVPNVSIKTSVSVV